MIPLCIRDHADYGSKVMWGTAHALTHRTGKTMLMDMFYDSFPSTHKRRIHFHQFSISLYSRIHQWQYIHNQSLLTINHQLYNQQQKIKHRQERKPSMSCNRPRPCTWILAPLFWRIPNLRYSNFKYPKRRIPSYVSSWFHCSYDIQSIAFWYVYSFTWNGIHI